MILVVLCKYLSCAVETIETIKTIETNHTTTADRNPNYRKTILLMMSIDIYKITQYIICIYLINNIRRFFPSNS